MAAAVYASDLTPIIEDMSSTTGWTALGGGAGGLVAPETDFFKQGNNCISKAGWSSAVKGMIYNYGSGITVPSGKAIYFFTEYWAPASLDTEANGGIQCLIGSGSGAFRQHYANGKDKGMAATRFPMLAVDPTRSAEATTGSPTATLQYFGVQANVPSGGPSKGQPLAIDAIRYGRDFTITNGDVGNGYATLSGAVTYSTDITRKYQLDDITGDPVLIGRLILGTSGTAVDFRESNKKLKIGRSKCCGTSFSGIEVNNASSRVDMIGWTISPIDTATQRGYFLANANATIDHSGATFEDFGTITYGGSNSAAVNPVYRRCDRVTLSGGQLTGALFDKSHDTVAAVVTTLNNLISCSFVSAGTGHAVDLGTISSTQSMNWTSTVSGYAATNGSTGNEVIKVNVASGQTLTINNASGATLSVYNTGSGTVSVVTGQTTVTIQAQVSLAGAEVRIYDNDGGSHYFGTELAGTESNGSSTYQYTGTQGNSIIIQVMLDGYEEYSQVYVMPTANTTLSIDLQEEENA